MHWQLNRLHYPIYNLGPGKRIGIWTQGCSLHCPGCVSQSLWNPSHGKAIEVERLAEQIAVVQSHFDGITITGGEPFDQYRALLVFCALIKSLTDMTILVFSGYYLTELQRLYPDQTFMRYIDYLVDGRYERQHHEDCNVRGSANQHIYAFEHDTPVQRDALFSGQTWSVAMSDTGQIFLSGIPKHHDLQTLERELQDAGLEIRFHEHDEM